jgi:hypothetical protein
VSGKKKEQGKYFDIYDILKKAKIGTSVSCQIDFVMFYLVGSMKLSTFDVGFSSSCTRVFPLH